MASRSYTASACAALFLMLALVPPTASGQVAGGLVGNALPLAPLADVVGDGTANVGSALVFTGSATDNNGEQDFATLKAEVTVGETTTPYTVSLAGIQDVTAKPDEFTSGWKVWNCGGARDGGICHEFEFTFTSTGSMTVAFSAADSAGYGDPGEDIVVVIRNAIQVDERLVLLDGTPAAEDARWGAWTAFPGQQNVLAANFLKVTNTGVDDSQQFTVDFTEAEFGGISNTTWAIDIDDNVEYACAQTLTGAIPDDLDFSFQPSLGGGATCQFGAGSAEGAGIMYVQYRIAAVPAPLMGQSYGASYTVSA